MESSISVCTSEYLQKKSWSRIKEDTRSAFLYLGLKDELIAALQSYVLVSTIANSPTSQKQKQEVTWPNWTSRGSAELNLRPKLGSLERGVLKMHPSGKMTYK